MLKADSYYQIPAAGTATAGEALKTYMEQLAMKKTITVCASILLLLAAGCSHRERAEGPARRPASTRPVVPSVDFAKIRPNELGRVMILEYHDVGPREERWTRRSDSFRADLRRLYDLGYRPISLRDYVANNISVPPGKIPVILTFDDGTEGQFRYVYANGERKVDPDCAVGILEQFHRGHPDWPLEATFYVYYPVPFRDRATVADKLRHIASLGMDIGNHTHDHTRLDLDSDAEAARQMAMNAAAARKHVPGAIVDSIALPYGKAPRARSVLISGSHGRSTYHNVAALLVGAEPAPSPVSRDFDPYRLPRVQAIQSELDMWLGYFKRHPDRAYVSDGDPDTVTVPKELAAQVDKIKLGAGRNLRTY